MKPTPLLENPLLNSITDKKVFIKPEFKQWTGSFKYRGAYNFISQLDRTSRNGVIAGSSGNHGIAVSSIAEKFGVNATLCIPKDAPREKLIKINKFNPRVILFDRQKQDRTTLTEEIAGRDSLHIIPSSDHEKIIAGTGTIGIEMLEEHDGLDVILIPVGGGGLASGVALAAHHMNPRVQVIGVEPEIGCDTKISLKANRITSILTPNTIADGLRHTQPGQLTFPIMKKHLDDVMTVTEEEILSAINFSHTKLGLKIEASSAVVIAALLYKKLPENIRKIGVVLSGSNYDHSLLYSGSIEAI
ncbi:threonine/serine dehydratase [Bacillus pakistanensis]|uniref:threonine ammonia-lyase n=1 Tax=Rossellomorea pakistanensis TaxID=992288 RepID=UPI0030840BA0